MKKSKPTLLKVNLLSKKKQAQAQSALKDTASQLEDYIIKSNVLPQAVIKSLEKSVQQSSIQNKPTPVNANPVTVVPPAAVGQGSTNTLSAEEIIKTYETLMKNQQVEEAKKIMNDALEACDQHLNEPHYIECKKALVAHLQPLK